MPSLKMKTKSTTGCLKEHRNLRVCHKSNMISKDPISRARVGQNAGEIYTLTLCNQNTSVYDEAHGLNLGEDEISHDESSNEENLLLEHPPTICDSTTVDMEPTLSTDTSNMDATFSSIIEAIDFDDTEGSDNLYVPQLDTEDSDDGSKSSGECQACSVSDFNISDLIFSAPSVESSSEFDHKTDAVFLPDNVCKESSFFCDLKVEYTVSPFLENTLDTGCDHDDRQAEDNIVETENSSLYLAIQQLRSHNQDSDTNNYPGQDYECFDPQLYIHNLPDQLDLVSPLLSTPALNKNQYNKQITLVLDLDETLVHSTLDDSDDADFTFPVFFNMKEHIVYVKKRPHLETFLKRVSEMFEIVVFTASQSIYAEQLLDILDPEKMIISRRAYRESCILSEGGYMKDLTVLGVDLAKVAIIDNSPQVFSLQVNNGIPIKSWFNDPSDCALISLLPFLETLVGADDVRPVIARKFGNKE